MAFIGPRRALLKQSPKEPSPVGLPTGYVGLWFADTYSNGVIPNQATLSAPIANLLRAPRRMFSNAQWWHAGGSAIVDSAVTAPDGSGDASTLVGTGNWFLGPINPTNVTLPSGTYTIGINVKSNTGSSQQFSFTIDNTASRSSAYTATTSWQRFTYTFTGAPQLNKILLCSIDGSTGANIQICDFEMFSGSADLGPEAPAGHLYLGSNVYDTRPVSSAGAIDLSASGYGLIQFPGSSFTTVTAIALTSKISTASSHQAFLSDVHNYNAFTAYMDNSNAAATIKGGPFGEVNGVGLWGRLSLGYHSYTHRFDGTTEDLFVDDIRVCSISPQTFSDTINDLFVGIVNDVSLTCGDKISAIALYSRALSTTEVRAAVSFLQARAAISGISASPARIYCAEGDSISGGFTYCYPYLFGPNASPGVFGADSATSGAGVATMVSRAATVDAIIPSVPNSRKFILSVLIGRNDLLGGNGATVVAFLSALSAYCDARRAAGWKVVLCTILPSTASGFNPLRNTANATIVTWGGVHADAICDFASNVTMGPDSAASNTSLYPDGTHPSSSGQAILETMIQSIINSL